VCEKCQVAWLNSILLGFQNVMSWNCAEEEKKSKKKNKKMNMKKMEIRRSTMRIRKKYLRFCTGQWAVERVPQILILYLLNSANSVL